MFIRLVYNEIPSEAIIGHVPLDDIENLAKRNSCIDAMMTPIRTSPNTPTARRAFNDDILGARPGITIGALLGVFLPRTQVNEPIVMDFITTVTQNWSNCGKSIPVDVESESFWLDIASGLENPFQVVHPQIDTARNILRSGGFASEESPSTNHGYNSGIQTPIRGDQPQILQQSTPPLTRGLSHSTSGKRSYATLLDDDDDVISGWDSATIRSTRVSASASPSVVELGGANSNDVMGEWSPLLPGIESYIDSSLSGAAASQHATTNQETRAQARNDAHDKHANLSMRIKNVVKREPGTGDWILYRDEWMM